MAILTVDGRAADDVDATLCHTSMIGATGRARDASIANRAILATFTAVALLGIGRLRPIRATIAASEWTAHDTIASISIRPWSWSAGSGGEILPTSRQLRTRPRLCVISRTNRRAIALSPIQRKRLARF